MQDPGGNHVLPDAPVGRVEVLLGGGSHRSAHGEQQAGAVVIDVHILDVIDAPALGDAGGDIDFRATLADGIEQIEIGRAEERAPQAQIVLRHRRRRAGTRRGYRALDEGDRVIGGLGIGRL